MLHSLFSFVRSQRPGREGLLYLAGVITITFVGRVILLSITTRGAAGVSWFADALLKDTLTILLFLVPYLLLHAWRGLQLGVRIAVQAILLFAYGLLVIAGIKYYLNYETVFLLSHLQHVEGGAQMFESIRSEFTAEVIWGTIGLLVGIAAWVAGAWGFVARGELPSHNKPVKQIAGRLALVVVGFVGLHLPYIALAQTRESRRAQDIQELSYNIIYDLSFGPDIGSPKRSVPDSHGPAAHNVGPFRFGFDTRSMYLERRHPRLPYAARGRKLNIVIFLFEGTSFEYIGKRVGGRPVTPHWDRLAANSIQMMQHHASNPLTINAIYSILTSAYPLPADRWAIKDYPNIRIPSLPEILGTQGYRTAAINTGYFRYAGQAHFLKARKFHTLKDVRQLRKPPYTKTLNWGIDDRALIRPALDFARDSGKQPFFVLMIPETPHHPYDIPEERFRLPGIDQSGLRSRSFAKYLSALHYADHVMGQTVAAFEKAGLGDDTLFFLVADHGEAFGQHRRNYNHPFYVYQENLHVPFLIYNRRLFKRRIVVERVTRHIDIMPTILDMLRLPSDKKHEGVSILAPGLPQMAYFNTTWRNNLAGLRDGRWKYIRNFDRGTDSLFDLQADPGEHQDLSAQHPALSARYRNQLFTIRAYQKRYYETVVGRKIDWSRRLSKEGL